MVNWPYHIDQDKAVDQLKEFIVAYMGLEISVIPKMHVLFHHLLPALSNPIFQERGLVVVSCQAGESIHQEFKMFWARYKINSLDSRQPSIWISFTVCGDRIFFKTSIST